MTPTAAGSAEYTPIFNWAPPRSRKVSLLSFIAGSVVLHALCFYIFQIIYPPTIGLLPPPARVNIITPDSEDGRVLLRWIEAEDPALSSTTQRPNDISTLLPAPPQHVPSYVNRRPSLREPSPTEPDLAVPSARPPGPVPRPRPPVPTNGGTISTRVDISPASDTFGTPEFPPMNFIASGKEPAQSARFRLAISARGEVRYCFLQESSGDSALDEQARRFLLLGRVPLSNGDGTKAETELRWTTATLAWGNDVAFPSASPAASTKP